MLKKIALVISLGVAARVVGPQLSTYATMTRMPRWVHLSNKTGDLPAPNGGTQQTASLVLDIDQDGENDFVITERTRAPAVVWYRRGSNSWTKYVLESDLLKIEAGGDAADIDGDGDLDIVMGGDASSNRVWWWENPHPQYDPSTPWNRREIKNSGANKHHDQLFGDFDGDGRAELVFWNQGALKLLLAPIPAGPRTPQPWPSTEIFSSPSESEGLAASDIDGDGKTDIVGGGRWFKHVKGKEFQPEVIDDTQRFSRAAAGQLKKGGWAEVVFVIGDGVGRLKWYEYNGKLWEVHDFLDHNVIHGHSLQVVDVDADGNLDIFCAEMAQWTANPEADNPNARMWIFFGDGQGNFTKTEVGTGFGNHESRVADLDGDGDLDLLGKPYTWDTPRVDVWLNGRLQGKRGNKR